MLSVDFIPNSPRICLLPEWNYFLQDSSHWICSVSNIMLDCWYFWTVGNIFFFFLAQHPRQWARVSSFTRFLDHTQRRISVGRTPLDEWSARRRDLYLTTHNTLARNIHAPEGFEPTIPASERPQTHALDRSHWDRLSKTLHELKNTNDIICWH